MGAWPGPGLAALRGCLRGGPGCLHRRSGLARGGGGGGGGGGGTRLDTAFEICFHWVGALGRAPLRLVRRVTTS